MPLSDRIDAIEWKKDKSERSPSTHFFPLPSCLEDANPQCLPLLPCHPHQDPLFSPNPDTKQILCPLPSFFSDTGHSDQGSN